MEKCNKTVSGNHIWFTTNTDLLQGLWKRNKKITLCRACKMIDDRKILDLSFSKGVYD